MIGMNPRAREDAMEAKRSNYEATKHQMQQQFLTHDLTAVAAEWELDQTPDALLLTFLGTDYAIDRLTGAVTFDDGGVRREADFNVCMTIFDILTRPRAHAAGEYMPIGSFSDVHTSAVLAGSFFDRSAKKLEGRCDALAEICRKLGGEAWEKGDVSYRLPVFRDLRVIVQFWDADEEFGTQLNFYCDQNLLCYMHYETMMFMLSHLAQKLAALCA